MVAAKQSYFHAVAQHRLGLVAKENKNFGEAVARMKVCVYMYLSPFTHTHTRTHRKLLIF